MAKADTHKLGLTFGIFAAALHALWAILVGIGVAEGYLNWILPLHFVSLVVPLTTFNFLSAIFLIVVEFIGGYIFGWFGGVVWNWVGKK